MKSMERYYRWVSKHYALTFGRIHQGLVDTIFRYNRRQGKGFYVAAMTHRALSGGPLKETSAANRQNCIAFALDMA